MPPAAPATSASAAQAMMPQKLHTPLCDMLGIRHPVVLAGMNVSGAEIAAAISNAGGLGVIGGVGYTPKMLRRELKELKEHLARPDLPFGVDLLLPKLEGGRKTNSDYTGGHLDELIDIIIESGAKLFVSAVGVPPKHVVDKLHKNGILIQNMCGAVKHALYAIEAGADIITAQGGEGGGHTGEVSTMVLIPQVVDAVRGKLSPLTGKQIPVIAAGGIFDGRGLAAALCMGAQGVWVGTRFVACNETKAPPRHIEAILKADSADTIRTTLYTGRPMRVLRTPYNNDWELNRKKEMLELESKGIVAISADAEKMQPKEGQTASAATYANYMPLLMGQASGAIKDVRPAKDILDDMVTQAAQIIKAVGPACRL